MASEAEQRFEMFQTLMKDKGAELSSIGFSTSKELFRAFFDPLPEKSEVLKSFGQIAMEEAAKRFGNRTVSETYDAVAQAVIAAYEARRPKPTVEDVAKALIDHVNFGSYGACTACARTILQLFGAKP